MVSFNKVTRVIAGIAATALLIPMAACGGGSSSGGSAAPADIPAVGTDDGTEITLWTRSPLERQAKNAVKAYNASHKNQVKLEIIPNDDMEGKVGGASQTDSLPDILAGDVVRIPYWASEGIFTDITKQIDGLDNKSDLQQGHIEAGTVDGKEYTLPFITDVSVMVWNKNLYKEAGLDPEKGPSSIDEFVEQAKAVAALNKDGVAGSYLAGQSGGALVFDLFPSVWADGESVMNADGTEATLNNDSMKAVLDGKQVAILVPTTVLAQQHYLTAMRRFATFPVTIDVLSRFRTPAQIKKTLFDLQSGKIDLIVGTHKLLQKEIHFKDLGLLIVDEEQRFGVTHKERLKELSRGVDVLTLSATPIPRTLNMALSGLRDMSTIEQPPQDRYPVQTFVLEHQDGILDEAMRRELARGGQVYYLHNRVESIDQCAAKIKQRIPEAEIAVAHGKMNEEQLGDVMQSMSNGEIQILVCTTIIETGIDIPNVNTLIIEDADRLGLAQLHQIRGRVGRSSRHAYAYLTFRKGKVLSEIAEKRLDTIREYAEFGSGFKIAMRDLEIRGAGDLLGAEQSGHMMTVGYDMYLKLLEDAVLEERGEEAQKEPECTADLTVTANINKDYVSSGEQRMDLYRRMAAIRTKEDADELLDEIVDRFGDPPKGVMNLIAIALLRARAAAAGVTEITQKDGAILLSLATMDFAAISACCAEAQFKGRIFFSAGKVPMLSVKLKKGEDALKLATQLVGTYAAMRAQTAEG